MSETILVPITLPSSTGIDNQALESALIVTIDALGMLTDLVGASNKSNPVVTLLVDDLMSHAVGMAQAAWLVDLSTGFRGAYSIEGRERLARAICLENNNNNETKWKQAM